MHLELLQTPHHILTRPHRRWQGRHLVVKIHRTRMSIQWHHFSRSCLHLSCIQFPQHSLFYVHNQSHFCSSNSHLFWDDFCHGIYEIAAEIQKSPTATINFTQLKMENRIQVTQVLFKDGNNKTLQQNWWSIRGEIRQIISLQNTKSQLLLLIYPIVNVDHRVWRKSENFQHRRPTTDVFQWVSE